LEKKKRIVGKNSEKKKKEKREEKRKEKSFKTTLKMTTFDPRVPLLQARVDSLENALVQSATLVDTAYIITAGALVFMMQSGFSMLEAYVDDAFAFFFRREALAFVCFASCRY
jgi:hypothetical protein